MVKKINNQQKSLVLILLFTIFMFFGTWAQIIKAQTQTEKSSSFCTGVGSVNQSGSPCKTILNPANFVFYCQDDPKWANGCAMPASGCGPTSAAMIVSTLSASTTGIATDPDQMDTIFRTVINARTCGGGTSVPTFADPITGSHWLENHGFDSVKVAKNNPLPGNPDVGYLNLDDAQRRLQEGYVILTSSYGAVYPCQGDSGCNNPNGFIDHVFVIDAVDVTHNTFEVRDPANCLPSQGYIENPNNMTRSNTFLTQAAYAITNRQR